MDMRLALISPLAQLAFLREDAVHRPNRADVVAALEKRGVDLGGRLVSELLRVERVEQARPFVGRELSRGATSAPRPLLGTRGRASVQGGPTEPECVARDDDRDGEILLARPPVDRLRADLAPSA